MNLSAKIDLENRIFARAARLSVPVDGVRGRLSSPADEAHLQSLISVYNRFFADENRALFPEEDSSLTWRYFKQERRFLPFLCPIKGGPVFASDFKANLFYLQN